MLIQRGFKADRLEVIYNGIELKDEPEVYSRDEFFGRLNVPLDDSKKYVGIAARLFAVKGVDVFLKAAKLVCDNSDDIRFLVLGDGDMWQQCQDYIKANSLEGKVYMVGQVTDAKLMNSYYKYIDVNTLTSYSESFPYALLEGARSRCATIATAVGGIPEMIEDGKDGLLATSGDERSIADCMLMLCNNDNVREKLGESFYQKTVAKFSAEAMARTHYNIYNKIKTK
jgi:glycosyltransferase involved in cell wall biosynthesis